MNQIKAFRENIRRIHVFKEHNKHRQIHSECAQIIELLNNLPEEYGMYQTERLTLPINCAEQIEYIPEHLLSKLAKLEEASVIELNIECPSTITFIASLMSKRKLSFQKFVSKIFLEIIHTYSIWKFSKEIVSNLQYACKIIAVCKLLTSYLAINQCYTRSSCSVIMDFTIFYYYSDESRAYPQQEDLKEDCILPIRYLFDLLSYLYPLTITIDNKCKEFNTLIENILIKSVTNEVISENTNFLKFLAQLLLVDYSDKLKFSPFTLALTLEFTEFLDRLIVGIENNVETIMAVFNVLISFNDYPHIIGIKRLKKLFSKVNRILQTTTNVYHQHASLVLLSNLIEVFTEFIPIAAYASETESLEENETEEFRMSVDPNYPNSIEMVEKLIRKRINPFYVKICLTLLHLHIRNSKDYWICVTELIRIIPEFITLPWKWEITPLIECCRLLTVCLEWSSSELKNFTKSIITLEERVIELEKLKNQEVKIHIEKGIPPESNSDCEELEMLESIDSIRKRLNLRLNDPYSCSE